MLERSVDHARTLTPHIGLSSFVHLANTAAELERHHSGGLVKAPPSRLRSASTLAAVQLPTDNN